MRARGESRERFRGKDLVAVVELVLKAYSSDAQTILKIPVAQIRDVYRFPEGMRTEWRGYDTVVRLKDEYSHVTARVRLDDCGVLQYSSDVRKDMRV
jgi:hypothetical protein